MPHRHKPRRNKLDRQLITRQQAVPAQPDANVIEVEFRAEHPEVSGNRVQRMAAADIDAAVDRITRRYEAAEPFTQMVAEEIERSERQFAGLYEDQELYQEPDQEDSRIFMRKTLEYAQTVHAHLDNLTGQLNPLVVLHPEPSGVYPFREEFRRSKVKELLVNYYFRRTRFKKDLLPRWRWNYLKHPSAYVRVTYDTDPQRPDIRFDLVDRASLFIDPNVRSGDIKDAGWVIERDWITVSKLEQLVRDGHYYLPGGMENYDHLARVTRDPTIARMTGQRVSASMTEAYDEDRRIERWHYWQPPKDGQPHAYGVILGGRMGVLVRWGDNPYPYKGIPFRGKAYLRDAYRPDGMSLAMQYRSLQEVYNTFVNLRIEDVLENVKRKVWLVEQLFGENTKDDLAKDQKYVRLNGDLFQSLMETGQFDLRKFMSPEAFNTSTETLFQDFGLLTTEGKEQTSVGDVFRGQNPQAGATLGQVQEQLFRALGVFRPVFQQEMNLIEELAEITCTYFEDPAFFGAERIATIIGPNRYREVIDGWEDDPASGFSARPVTPDEMDVDVSVDAVSQAEHMASRTMRMGIITGMLDSLRHHPELMKESMRVINYPAILQRFLQDAGEDIEAITYTDRQQQENSQRSEAERKASMREQVDLLRAGEAAKAEGKAIEHQARSQAEVQAKQAILPAETQAGLAKELRTILAEHRAEMERMRLEHQQELERMREEAALERQNTGVSVGHGGNVNQ